jgi:hypothetical protein
MKITVTYTAKWRLKDSHNYKWTECKKLINTNTGLEIQKTLHGLTPGYWIGKKFIKLADMAIMVELIPTNEFCPF